MVGFGAVVVDAIGAPDGAFVPDGKMPGQVALCRGGTVPNVLAVVAATGASARGALVVADDALGTWARQQLDAEKVTVVPLATASSIVNVVLAHGGQRGLIAGGGEREYTQDPIAVTTAAEQLDWAGARWAVTSMRALASPAGSAFADVAAARRVPLAVLAGLSVDAEAETAVLRARRDQVGVVFANAGEWVELRGAGAAPRLAVVTDGPGDVVVYRTGQPASVHPVPADPTRSVLDSTGAGDAFAGGVLATLTPQERDDAACVAGAIAVGQRAAWAVMAKLGADVGHDAPTVAALAELGALGRHGQ